MAYNTFPDINITGDLQANSVSGSNGDVLVSDGLGSVNWAAPSGSSTYGAFYAAAPTTRSSAQFMEIDSALVSNPNYTIDAPNNQIIVNTDGDYIVRCFIGCQTSAPSRWTVQMIYGPGNSVYGTIKTVSTPGYGYTMLGRICNRPAPATVKVQVVLSSGSGTLIAPTSTSFILSIDKIS